MAEGEAAHRLVIYNELIGRRVFIRVHSRSFAESVCMIPTTCNRLLFHLNADPQSFTFDS